MTVVTEPAVSIQSRDTRRKPRPKPARKVRWVERPGLDTDGWGAVQIAVGREQPWTYLIAAIPCHLGQGLYGYEMVPLMPDLAERGDTYHVVLDTSAQRCHSCECLGFLRWGRCKHIDSLVALRADPRSPWAAIDPPALSRLNAIDPPPF